MTPDAAGKDDASRQDGGDADAACASPSTAATCREAWCEIPAGCFWMGSPETEFGRGKNTEPLREVSLTHPFIIQEYELRVSEWTALGKTNWNRVDGNGFGDCMSPDCPAAGMTWFEAALFANEVSARNGLPACYAISGCIDVRADAGAVAGPVCTVIQSVAATPYDCSGVRLPTDAEWEYATRAGTKTASYGGEITPILGDESACVADPALDPIGWFCFNTGAPVTRPAGSKAPNAWGLHDTLGNAFEWVMGPWGAVTSTAPAVDPWALQSPDDRTFVVRGGCPWCNSRYGRAAYRHLRPHDAHDPAVGVRLVRSLRPGEVGMKWSAPVFAADAGVVDAGGQ